MACRLMPAFAGVAPGFAHAPILLAEHLFRFLREILKGPAPAGVSAMEPDDMNPGMAQTDHPAREKWDGERELETVMATHESPLLRYAGRLLNNAAAAQDVVQSAFLKLCDCWEESRGWTDAHRQHWLYRVTHNAALDFIRKEERLRKLHEKHAGEAAPDDPPRQYDALELADRQRLALEAMQALGAAEREVLVLRLQQGLSYAEIAKITGRSEGNVGCLLSMGTKQLAQRLRKTGALAS